jgi:hypothetical protein
MKIDVRFFIVDFDLEDGPDVKRVTENEFLDHEGSITYDRFTVRENGVSCICLTKGLPSCT